MSLVGVLNAPHLHAVIIPPAPEAISPTRIEVRIDAPIVAAKGFVEKAAALLDLVNAVAMSMGGRKKRPPQWIIRDLRIGSAVLVIDRDREDRHWDEATVSQAVLASREGILSLARPDNPRPPMFSPRALKLAKRLAKPEPAKRAGRLTLVMGGEMITPAPQIAARVLQLVTATNRSIGSIEGKLVNLSSLDGYSIAITDHRTDQQVRCVFAETMKARVRALFDEKVRAHGVLWSTEDGRRVEFELRHIEPFDDGVTPIPSIAEMRGALRRPRATK